MDQRIGKTARRSRKSQGPKQSRAGQGRGRVFVPGSETLGQGSSLRDSIQLSTTITKQMSVLGWLNGLVSSQRGILEDITAKDVFLLHGNPKCRFLNQNGKLKARLSSLMDSRMSWSLFTNLAAKSHHVLVDTYKR